MAKDIVLSRQFRAWDSNFRKSPLWRKIVRQFPKDRVKDFRCLIGHLVECCGQCGASCDDSILPSFEATYGEDPMPLVEYLVAEGFMKYDEPSGWIWLPSGAWWQNPAFNGDCSQWTYEQNRSNHGLKGNTGAFASWKAIIRDVFVTDFPFKREFVDLNHDRLRFDIASVALSGFGNYLAKITGDGRDGPAGGRTPVGGGVGGGSDPGRGGVGGGSDPGRGGVGGGSDPGRGGGRTPVEGGSAGGTRTGTGTGTGTDRSFVEDPHACEVRGGTPNERTPDEDGCPFTDIPHSTEDATPQPEPEETHEPPRSTSEGVRVGPPAVGVPKAGGPRVGGGHPLAGMGSTRPPPPLVTLAEWQGLTLDAKVKHVQAPATCAPDLRERCAVVRSAADAVLADYRAATEAAGYETDPEAFDAIDRCVVLRLEREDPEVAADTLRRLVAWASTAPDGEGVGKPVRGRPAWLSAWALFGAPEGAARGWKPTAARLPENLNAMVAAQGAKAKADERRLRVVRSSEPEEPEPMLEGFSNQEILALGQYRLSLMRRVILPDPAKDQRLAEYDAAVAAQRAARKGAGA